MAHLPTPPPIHIPGDRAVRIDDVAAAAGVSTATVSRTLASPERVRPETRNRVLAAVRHLGYTPNEAARSLRAGATRMVLVVLPYRWSNTFFSAVVKGIDQELARRGYTAIIGSLDHSEEQARRLVDLVYARQIDGVILLTGTPPLIGGRSILDTGIPVVSICAEIDRPGVPTVLINDEACAEAQTRHLLELGHKRLLYVSGIAGNYNEVLRYRGFRAALRAAGMDEDEHLYFQGNYELLSGVEAGNSYLGLEDRPTGVVCCSDEMAIGFLKTITLGKVKCPRDVSIVGFDGIEFADYVEPTLSTILQPRLQMGEAGARLLLDTLQGEPAGPGPVVFEGLLLARATSGPAPVRG